MEEIVQELDPLSLIIVGILLPPLQALVNQYGWTPTIKAFATIAVSAAVGALVGWFEGVDTREGWVATLVAVYAAGQLGYFGIWRPSGAANALEKATSLPSSNAPPE